MIPERTPGVLTIQHSPMNNVPEMLQIEKACRLALHFVGWSLEDINKRLAWEVDNGRLELLCEKIERAWPAEWAQATIEHPVPPHLDNRSHHMPKTQIFQHGEDVSVVTDALDERDLLESFAIALNELEKIDRKVLSAGFDLVAKLRNYKSQVHERRVLAAGRWPHPTETPVAEGALEDAPEEEPGDD